MAIKINSNIVIANFFIFTKSDDLTYEQVYKYMNIFDNKLKTNQIKYFTSDINIQDLVDKFGFIFKMNDNGISITSTFKEKKDILERYFRLGLPKDIIILLDETKMELLQLENKSEIKMLIKDK